MKDWRLFAKSFFNDSLSMKRVELSVATFSSVRLLHDFTTVDEFRTPNLVASGNTPLGKALEKGLDVLKNRKKLLCENGIKLFRPWIFLITDGEPTDNWKHIPKIIRQGEENKSFSFFALGVKKANFEILKQISMREPMKLSGIKFTEFFLWLSASLKSVSHSNPGDKVSLPDYKPYGWSEV